MSSQQEKYKIICRKKSAPDTWAIRCICNNKASAEKFMQILENVSDVYAELRIVPVTINIPDSI